MFDFSVLQPKSHDDKKIEYLSDDTRMAHVRDSNFVGENSETELEMQKWTTSQSNGSRQNLLGTSSTFSDDMSSHRESDCTTGESGNYDCGLQAITHAPCSFDFSNEYSTPPHEQYNEKHDSDFARENDYKFYAGNNEKRYRIEGSENGIHVDGVEIDDTWQNEVIFIFFSQFDR